MTDTVLFSLNGQGIYTYETLIEKLGIGRAAIDKLAATGRSFYGNIIKIVAYKGWIATNVMTGKEEKALTLEELSYLTGKASSTLYRSYKTGNGEYNVREDYIFTEKDKETEVQKLNELEEMLRKINKKYEILLNWAAAELADLDGHLTELGYYDYNFMTNDGEMMIDPEYDCKHPIEHNDWKDIMKESVRQMFKKEEENNEKNSYK